MILIFGALLAVYVFCRAILPLKLKWGWKLLLAALLVLIFLSSCAAGKNTSMTPAATDFAYAEDYS
mgnify:FL=1